MSANPDTRQKHAKLTGAERGYTRRAQLLPYHWNQLSPGEVAELRIKLARNPQTHSSKDREIRLAVSLILETGHRLADLYDLKIYLGVPEDAQGHPGVFLNRDEGAFLRLPAGFTKQSAARKELNASGHGETAAIPSQSFLTPIGQPPSDWPSIDGKLRPKFPKKAPKWRRRPLLDPTPGRSGPLSDHQVFECPVPELVSPFLPDIGSELPKRLFKLSIDDLLNGVEAFLGSRRENGYASRRVAKRLRALERQRWNELFLTPGGHDVHASRLTNSIPAPNYPAGYYGSSRPGPAAKNRRAFSPGSQFSVPDDLVRAVARQARKDATTLGGPKAFAALSDYSATMISFAIGHRGNFDHLPSVAAIDAQTGFCVLQDKDVRDETSPRLVWVCDSVREQIFVYECELRNRIENGSIPKGAVLLTRLNKGELVFPDRNGEPQKISRIVRRTFARVRSAQANIGRHWLATRLQGVCSTETINAFLGHWAEGASPWSHGSCLDPRAYRADLQRSLPNLLREVGWIPTDRRPEIPSKLPLNTQDAAVPIHSDGPKGARSSPFFERVLGRDIDAVVDFAKLSQAIEHSPPGDFQFEIGRALASAVVNGALLHSESWGAFVQALPQARRREGVRWLLLKSAGGLAPSVRWIGDRTTDKCVQRCFRLFGKARLRSETDPIEPLESFLFRALGSRLAAQDFARAATLRWRLRLPAILMDHALSETPCSSLYHIASYGRAFTANRTSAVSPRASFSTFRSEQMEELKRRHREYAYAFNDVSSIQRWGAAGHQSRKRICAYWLAEAFNRRKATRRKFPAPRAERKKEALLVGWAIHRLGERRPHRSSLGYSTLTVESRFSILANLILPKISSKSVSCEDVRIATRSSWSEITNPADANTVWQAGRCFERYLRNLSGIPEADAEAESASTQDIASGPNISSSRDFQGTPRAEKPPSGAQRNVYAKILIESAYIDALSKLGKLENAAELQLIAILGYRAGLRLPEAAGLLVSDFVDVDGAFELHLDHNYLRRLKTPNSRRILPIRILLANAELANLKRRLTVRSRHAEALGLVDAPLFGPITAKSIMLLRHYQGAIEASLGTSAKPGRFEILRHSFASFLFANLLSPDFSSTDGLPVELRENISPARRRLLVDHFVGPERLGKSSLHAVSQALGHTGIHRTLESYLHLLDVSLGMHVNRDNGFTGRSCPSTAAPTDSAVGYAAPATKDPGLFGDGPHNDGSNRREVETALVAVLEEQALGLVPASLDWTIIWLSISKGPEAISGLLDAYGVSQEFGVRCRTIAAKILPGYFKHTRSAQALQMPKGPHPVYRMNYLWLSARKPSAGVKRAIARFVGNADRNNRGSKLEDILQLARLLKYFDQCDVHAKHVVYALGSETESVPPSLKVIFDRVDVGWDEKEDVRPYPRLAFEKLGNGSEHDNRPLGRSADLSRLGRDAPDKSEHRQFVYALRLWVVMLACFYDLQPSELEHANSKSVRPKIKRVALRMEKFSPRSDEENLGRSRTVRPALNCRTASESVYD